jgi:hypothetical protein
VSTLLESVQAVKDAIYDAKNETEDDPCDIWGELEEALDAINRAESALEFGARSGQEGQAIGEDPAAAETVAHVGQEDRGTTWTPTNAEVSAGERVLAEVAGCSADGFWRPTAEAVLIAAHETRNTIERVDPDVIRRYRDERHPDDVLDTALGEGRR